MVTHCFGNGFFEFEDTEALFLQITFLLLKIVIPGAICLIAWRMLITDRAKPRRTVLGLDEVTPINASVESDQPRTSPKALFFCGVCYGVVGLLTFGLGLLSSALFP
jgi:hypothetical protein